MRAQRGSPSYQSRLHERRLVAIHSKQNSAEARARKEAALREKLGQLGATGGAASRKPGKPPPPPTNVIKRDVGAYNRRAATHDPAAERQQQEATDPDAFLSQAERLIPAEFVMISGCEDEQTSMDVGNAAGGLPDPRGRAGGAATSNLLEILYDAHRKGERPTFQQVLMTLRAKLASQGLPQIPQLTSSRPLDIDGKEFAFHRDDDDGPCAGTKRAVLVGINYEGQSGQLSGCANDAYHMKDYLTKIHGFREENITLLTDDATGSRHGQTMPTKQKLIAALQHLVDASRSGDSVFFHYSGHGGFLEADYNSLKRKNDRYDQTLIPLDHRRAGQIRDFNLFNHFVRPMPRGVTVTCLMDCCHSGSVLDLPYSYKPTAEGEGQYRGMMDGGDMAGIAFLSVLGGQVLDYMLFSSVMDNLSQTLGPDWESEYSGIYEQELINDVVDYDEDEGDEVVELDEEVQQEIERQVDEEINNEIEQEVEAELGPQLEDELNAEMEAEIQAQVEAEIEAEYEAQLQQQAELEAQQQQQAELEAQQQAEYEAEMERQAELEAQQQAYYEDPPEEDYDFDDGGGFGGGDY